MCPHCEKVRERLEALRKYLDFALMPGSVRDSVLRTMDEAMETLET